jgi:hypothetical protein
MIRTTFTLLSVFLFNLLSAQRTVGLTEYTVPNADGYVIFSPITSTKTYMIDKCGKKINEWTTVFRPGQYQAVILPNGDIIRNGIHTNPTFSGGGTGGILERYDWNNNLVWSYIVSDTFQTQHHDFKVMPNGNILVLVWDARTKNEAIQNGKNTSYNNTYLWSEKIYELQPVGTDSAVIVWTWELWDHLIQDLDSTKPNYGVVADHPELADLNYFTAPPASSDWVHLNSIDYNETLDQILLSAHAFDEIWIIDHSATTAEAATHAGGNAGKGGDLLYRWGNPRAYKRGTVNDQKFFAQHHATWIPDGFVNEGKICVFNNGMGRPGGNYSSVDIIEPPLNGYTYNIGSGTPYGPQNLFWSYSAPVPSDFYAMNISGAWPLVNGSFIITQGPAGRFFEIDSSKNIVWEYINPVNTGGIITQGNPAINNNVFRANFYPDDYAGFNNLTLTPGAEIEINPIVPSLCDLVSVSRPAAESLLNVFPNPADNRVTVQFSSYENINASVKLFNQLGKDFSAEKFILYNSHSVAVDISDLPGGIYFLQVNTDKVSEVIRLIVQH